MAENLSDKGIPVLLMDIKGDLSGLAKPSPGHTKIDERHVKTYWYKLKSLFTSKKANADTGSRPDDKSQ